VSKKKRNRDKHRLSILETGGKGTRQDLEKKKAKILGGKKEVVRNYTSISWEWEASHQDSESKRKRVLEKCEVGRGEAGQPRAKGFHRGGRSSAKQRQ